MGQMELLKGRVSEGKSRRTPVVAGDSRPSLDEPRTDCLKLKDHVCMCVCACTCVSSKNQAIYQPVEINQPNSTNQSGTTTGLFFIDPPGNYANIHQPTARMKVYTTLVSFSASCVLFHPHPLSRYRLRHHILQQLMLEFYSWQGASNSDFRIKIATILVSPQNSTLKLLPHSEVSANGYCTRAPSVHAH